MIGNKNFPIDFVVVDMPTDTLCPVIFRRNFLNDIGAKVDFKKEIVSLKLGELKRKKNSTFPNLKKDLYKYKEKRKTKLLKKWQLYS